MEGCGMKLSDQMYALVRGPVLFRWAAEAQCRRALELQDGSSRTD